ncbi:MAG: hypothetical protein EA401_12335, partial [Planctomycetota bacterium]
MCLSAGVGIAAHEHGPECGSGCGHGDVVEVFDEEGAEVQLRRCDGPPPMQDFDALADSVSLEYFFLEQPSSSVPLSGDVEIDALRASVTNAYYNNQSTVITYSFYS